MDKSPFYLPMNAILFTQTIITKIQFQIIKVNNKSFLDMEILFYYNISKPFWHYITKLANIVITKIIFTQLNIPSIFVNTDFQD
jgi:hypothetical protein